MVEIHISLCCCLMFFYTVGLHHSRLHYYNMSEKIDDTQSYHKEVEIKKEMNEYICYQYVYSGKRAHSLID